MSIISFHSDIDDDYHYHLSFGYDESEKIYDLNYNNRFDLTSTNDFWLIYFSKRLTMIEKEKLKLDYLKQNPENEVFFFEDLNKMLDFFIEKAHGLQEDRTDWEIQEIVSKIKLFVKIYENPLLDEPADFEEVFKKLGEEVFLDVINYNGGIESVKKNLGVKNYEEAGGMQLINFEKINLSLINENGNVRILPKPLKSLGEFLFELYDMNNFYKLNKDENIELIQ